MLRKSKCPYLVCRSGLWYIVRPGCRGILCIDALNRDLKVWFTECQSCYQGRIFNEPLEEVGESHPRPLP